MRTVSNRWLQTSLSGKNKEPQITITGMQNNNDSNTNIRLKFESLKLNLLFNESENFLKIIYDTINLLPPSPIHY